MGLLIKGEVKDKRMRRWEARTFMGMVAAFAGMANLSRRGIMSMPNIHLAGFPLALPTTPCDRSSGVKTRKKFMKLQRRSRINRRGWA